MLLKGMGCLHAWGLSAQETALKLPSPGDTVGASPLGRVLVKMDIFILGTANGNRNNEDGGGTVWLNLRSRLCIVLAKCLY